MKNASSQSVHLQNKYTPDLMERISKAFNNAVLISRSPEGGILVTAEMSRELMRKKLRDVCIIIDEDV